MFVYSYTTQHVHGVATKRMRVRARAHVHARVFRPAKRQRGHARRRVHMRKPRFRYLCFLLSWLNSLIPFVLMERRNFLASLAVMPSGPFIANSAVVSRSSSCAYNTSSPRYGTVARHPQTINHHHAAYHQIGQPRRVLAVSLVHRVAALCTHTRRAG